MVRICDIMHKGVIFCYPNDSVKEVSKILHTNGIRSVVVIDESGEVWGLISRLEVINVYGKDLDKIRAEEIMRSFRIEIDPQAPIEEAIELMKKRKFEHLIIVDPHAGPTRPVGILSSNDIVLYMSGLKIGSYEYLLKMHKHD